MVELQHGLADVVLLLVNCRVSVSTASSSLHVTSKHQIPFQITNLVYNVKQKQREHFEHLGGLLFDKVLIRFFKMQIRNCNKLGCINVVTNDVEHFRVLHKMLSDMLSMHSTPAVSTDHKQAVYLSGKVAQLDSVGFCCFSPKVLNSSLI